MDRWCRMPNANLMLFYSLHSWQTHTNSKEYKNLDLEVTTLSNIIQTWDIFYFIKKLFLKMYCIKKLWIDASIKIFILS